jgi:hypothetical protein
MTLDGKLNCSAFEQRMMRMEGVSFQGFDFEFGRRQMINIIAKIHGSGGATDKPTSLSL